MLVPVAVSLTVVTVGFLFMRRKKEFSLVQKNFEKDVVYVFTYTPSGQVPNPSPFCMKVLLYLKHRNIPHVQRYDLYPGPRGLLPYIELNGVGYSDSTFIMQMLDSHFKGKNHPSLSVKAKADQAVSTAVQRILENSLYWSLLRFRWYEEEGWAITSSNLVFNAVPKPFVPFIKHMAQKQTCAKMEKVGILQYTKEEVQSMCERDLAAISHFLGDKEYFHGEQMTETDLIVFSFTANLYYFPLQDSITKAMRKHKNLREFTERMKVNFEEMFVFDQ